MAKGRHGLTVEQIYSLAEHQNFECPLSGVKLEVRDGEIYDPTTGKRISIDHDHTTGLIRGLLVQKANWLIDHDRYLCAYQWLDRRFHRLEHLT